MDGDGETEVLRITPEHPVHLEHWDAKPRGDMLASLQGLAAATTAFPTAHEATQFGDWVKAGAIRAGDQLSTAGSITHLAEQGPTLLKAAAINGEAVSSSSKLSLTVQNTRLIDRATRVYNLEINSRNGEITHNYLVGDDEIWVHNKVGVARCIDIAIRIFVAALGIERDPLPRARGGCSPPPAITCTMTPPEYPQKPFPGRRPPRNGPYSPWAGGL